MRVLVTGSNGFTGKALMPYLRDNGYEVFGFSQSAIGDNQFAVNLLDKNAVDSCIQKVQPDYIIHLAGIALPSFHDIELMYQINMFGTKNLLDSVHAHCSSIKKVIVASTAHVYGVVDNNPVTEDHKLQPTSHYGNSKLAMENIARLYMDKLPIIITRPFNYTGKNQSVDYVIAKIVEHFKQNKSEITLGNIDVVRDFSYIDDILYYYLQLIKSDQDGFAVNLCSGIGTSIRDILTSLIELTDNRISIHSNSSLLRPQDNPVFYGDVTLLNTFNNGYTSVSVYQMLKKLVGLI